MGKICLSEVKEFGGVEFMLQMLLSALLGKVGSLPLFGASRVSMYLVSVRAWSVIRKQGLRST